MQGLSRSTLGLDGAGAFTAMVTPAVLLVVNAMPIRSTVQRLQAILARIRENEEDLRCGDPGTADRSNRECIRAELTSHGRRVRLAHRALLAFYRSVGALLVMMAALGVGSLGWPWGSDLALVAAFVGAGFLLGGAGSLVGETLVGVSATDRRVAWPASWGCARRRSSLDAGTRAEDGGRRAKSGERRMHGGGRGDHAERGGAFAFCPLIPRFVRSFRVLSLSAVVGKGVVCPLASMRDHARGSTGGWVDPLWTREALEGGRPGRLTGLAQLPR